jgi:hypothetical protein
MGEMNVFGFMLAFVLGVFFIPVGIFAPSAFMLLLVGPVALAGSVVVAFDADRPKR